jgi:hypothetical protein
LIRVKFYFTGKYLFVITKTVPVDMIVIAQIPSFSISLELSSVNFVLGEAIGFIGVGEFDEIGVGFKLGVIR